MHAASQAPSQRPGSVFRGLASRVSQLSTQTRGTGLRYHVLGKQSKAAEHEPRHQAKNKNTEKNNTQTCPPRGPTDLNSSRGVMFAPGACFLQPLLRVRSSPFRGALVLFCSFQKKNQRNAAQHPSVCPGCSSSFSAPPCSSFLSAATSSEF